MRIDSSLIRLRRSNRLISARPLGPRDFSAWVEAESLRQPKQHSFDRDPDPKRELTRANFRKIISTYAKARKQDRNYNFAVFEKKTGRIVGDFYIHPAMRWNIQSCTIGYGIHNSCWRRGFGRAAVSAAIEIAFRELRFFRAEAHIHPGNKASIGLVKALGFRKEGRLRNFNVLEGKRVDNLVYAITAYEWGLKKYQPRFGLSLKEMV
jgi:RimJ/RimL family protein N-acetyltransferase